MSLGMSLDPPERLLMGPGPSNPDPLVTEALAKPIVGHLDPYFLELMDDTMELLRRLFETRNPHTIPMSGTGSSAIETMILNLVEPGDRWVVGVIGYFGERLVEMARRAGAAVTVLDVPPGEVISPDDMRRAVSRTRAVGIAMVHAETSTGACQPLDGIARIAREHDALIIADCVTSLGGMEVNVDGWGLDAAASCSQKCVGAPPGMGPVTLGERAMAAIARRRQKPATWYFDLNLVFEYWADGSRQRAFHHTAPISSIYGFHEALRLIDREGLEARFKRHRAAHEHLVERLAGLGMELFTPARHRLPMLNVVRIPDGVDDVRVRAALLRQGIEIGGGFGPLKGKVWRIGLMGVNADLERVDLLVDALEEHLKAARR